MSTIYDVLRRPLVTEKSNYQNSDLHQYVFEVCDGCHQESGERCSRDSV